MSNRQIPSIAPRRIVDLPPTKTPRERPPTPIQSAETELRVGRNIKLKGEIDQCAVLTVEGKVEAAFSGRLINVTEHGQLTGTCEVETAEIRGVFDGELTVTKILRIHERGRVNGTIRYGRLEIVGGGTIAGEVEALSTANTARPPVSASTGR